MMNLPDELHPVLLRIALNVIRASLRGERYNPASEVNPLLMQPAGCFVSLHDNTTHQLRGCIGSLDASRPLLHAIIGSAASVLEDPRFGHFPVTLAELPQLELELSALSPLQPAENPLAFDPQTEGLYLTIAGRSGCFLPQVAKDTGWGREQLLTRLCTEKMGLPAIAWKMPEAKLQTFTAMVIGPKPISEI
ncbi:MAG TPA: AmmeMemoRadiSam system protein A [Tepidisphaeraceae bacterium]|jgi:AmmeMemoRadiSam system protein A